MSTTGLFQPSRPDGRSDWRVVFDIVEKLEPGEEIDHEKLMAELDTDDRSRMYRAVGRANRELWATRSRSLAAVKGRGYRMLHADEHEVLATGYQKQARRKVSSAVAVIDATDFGALDDGERERTIRFRDGIHLLARTMDETVAKVARQEKLIDSLQHGQAQLQKRMDELESK